MITKRGKGRINSTYNAKAIYKWARIEIEYSVFKKVHDEFGKLLSELILDGEQVSLPIGKFSITKAKDGDKKRVDFGMTRKYGKTIFHLNRHSRGYHYKWKWTKLGYNFTNKSKYLLRPTRTNSRDLAVRVKNRQDYI